MQVNIRVLILALITSSILTAAITSTAFKAANYDYASGDILGDEDVVRFNSLDELISYVKAVREIYTKLGGIAYQPIFIEGFRGLPLSIVKATSFSIAQESVDFSRTNVQVAGVDEADMVKTDGKYIYLARGREVAVLKAYPPSELEVVSEVKVEGCVRGIYVYDDKLVVIYSSSTPEIKPLKTIVEISEAVVPADIYIGKITPFRGKVVVAVYDLSSKKKPTLSNKVEVSGRYVGSRMVKNVCYVITQHPIFLSNYIILPVVNGDAVSVKDIVCFRGDYPQVFTIVLALNVDSGDFNKEVFMTGVSSYIYMSRKNLYLLTQGRFYAYEILREIAKAVGVKPLTSRGEDIDNLKSMVVKLEDLFNQLPSEKRAKIWKEIHDKLWRIYGVKTLIYRFSIEGLSFKAEAKGEVPGRVLDQFSMDEYDGFFRVATTSRGLDGRKNNVYVLDMNLRIVGKLEGLAKGERVYAARYLGDKMFLVTYRVVDPLFTIDLSNPYKPEVIGYLKIPGFSEYLHPYGHYLIGIGRNGDWNGRGGGVKVSLFDISNLEKPVEVSSVTLNEATWSPVFTDHKAFLINSEEKYIAIPTYGKVDGVYVIGLRDECLSLRGFIEHDDVKRAVFIGDSIYTISANLVKAVSSTSLELICEVPLTEILA